MDDAPKITVEDMLKSPSTFYARMLTAEQEQFASRIFGYVPLPPRRRFDPRRLIDRFRKPRSQPTPPLGGSVVYDVADDADDLYS